MEAVGQLTGGVAHDFNNLLTAILGNLQLLEEATADDEELQDLARTATNAALRGADLTRRLLAFSRRQLLDPRLFSANDLISDMISLLHHTLGETIEIETRLAEHLWSTRSDPAQLESALLNLAINARDAMPGGGKLTIETANIHLDETYVSQHDGLAPGDYVTVTAADTGHGIAPESMERVFEPFYTTKKDRQRSGLGLSIVYGFVKQSGGHVEIDSVVGKGTNIKLFLPMAQAMGEPALELPASHETMPTGTETILVVEDEQVVREAVVTNLERLGYRVLEASDGPSALVSLDAHPEVDLLFTDVVMPGGMTGVDLTVKANKRRQGMKFLFTSGYATTEMLDQGVLPKRVEVLNKPYQREELARKVRAVLDH